MNRERELYLALRQKSREVEFHVAKSQRMNLDKIDPADYGRLQEYVEGILETYADFSHEYELRKSFKSMAAKKFGAKLAELLYQRSEAELSLVAWQSRPERLRA